ncbi:hypothetical protein PRUPE_8G241200 [Prunus persica]|uniref:Uncharacterized protein n=1 Tax=Prunus persica TaxID=3760 RepID=M5W6Y2_PRUPE|nr:uncharacterized protein LOC18768599 isoform X1 [Prunus persica]ONH93595.1 hypothetical protein PRUPE_8G241200 [Prunus persica]
MGRRPNASRKDGTVHTPKATQPLSETEEPQPEGPNPSSEQMDQQHENASPLLEKTNSMHMMQEKSTKSSRSKKRPKQLNSVVRRSLRIRNCDMPVQNQNIDPVIENISDSEMEEGQPLLEEQPTLGEKNMEEKIDYLIQLVETQNSKAKKRSPVFSKSPEIGCKSLYINSQMKIEALKNENHELSLKLEVALGKLEGYEKGTCAFSGVMDKMKDVILVSALSKATERVVNVSSQAIGDDALSPQEVQDRKSIAKRKK